MRGFGILGLVAAVVTTIFLAGTGCDDEKVDNCCKCICYVPTGSLDEVTDYISHTKYSCAEACAAQCVDTRGMSTKSAVEIDCSTLDTDL